MTTASVDGPTWLIRSGAFGDMVMMTAVATAIAKREGQPCHMLATGPWSPDLLDRCPAVTSYQLVHSMKTTWWCNPKKWRAVRAIRASHPGQVFVCGGDPGSQDLAARLRLPRDQVHHISQLQPLPDEHSLDWMLRFIDEPPGSVAPSLCATEADRRDAGTWMEQAGISSRPILIQAGNKKTMRRGRRTRVSNSKYWPEDRWQAVLSALLATHPDHHIVLCGTNGERQLCEDISAGLPQGRLYNAAGELPIGRLLALAEQALGMISVDTGPAHAAAAVGCPVAVLFGSTDPRRWAPRGPARITIVHGLSEAPQPGQEWWAAHHAMDHIVPDMVLRGWQQLFEPGGSSAPPRPS